MRSHYLGYTVLYTFANLNEREKTLYSMYVVLHWERTSIEAGVISDQLFYVAEFM